MKSYFILVLCVAGVFSETQISISPNIIVENFKLPCIGPGNRQILFQINDTDPGDEYIYHVSLTRQPPGDPLNPLYNVFENSKNGITEYIFPFQFPCNQVKIGVPYRFSLNKLNCTDNCKPLNTGSGTGLFHFMGCGLLTGECFKQPGCDDSTCKCKPGWKPVAYGCAKDNEVTTFHDTLCDENGVRIFQEDLKNIKIRTRCNITIKSSKVIVNRGTQLNTSAFLKAGSSLEYDLENKDDEGVFPFFKASEGGIMLLPSYKETFINVPKNINASISTSTQGGETVRSATIERTGHGLLIWVLVVSIIVCILIIIMIIIIIKKCNVCSKCNGCSKCKSTPKRTWELEGH